jgi:asparagine synthase (glutamine-hydrolysing)
MVQSLSHEPFYQTGTWVDEPHGIYAGWIARPGSFGGGGPLTNERGDVLLFAGEEYPEAGTVARLKARGHQLESEGPSYLIHRYEEEPSFPAELNGRFHGLLVDRGRNTAMLFNDRYGMCRLYYYESPEALYFAAEAKGILAVCPELRAVDSQSLGELISCGCILEDRTLFPGVFALPGASAWTFSHGALLEKRTYFQPREWEEQEPLEPEQYYEALRAAALMNDRCSGTRRSGPSCTETMKTRSPAFSAAASSSGRP